jgi:chemotaxis protein CheD
MTFSTATPVTADTSVGMGQIAAGRDAARLGAVLGSCVAVALYGPRQKTGAMAHVVLPKSNGRDNSPGKFADTAVPAMLATLAKMGTPPAAVVAKIAGGASMFGSGGPMQIGDANIRAVTDALKAAGIRLAGQDVGGKKGRRVWFHAGTGELTVQIVGGPPHIL